MINIIKKHLFVMSLLVLSATTILTFGNALAFSSLNSNVSPTISGFTASRKTLTAAGGTIMLSATVKNGVRCVFSVKPSITNFNKAVTCGNVKISRNATVPKNTGSVNNVYTFYLTVVGKTKTINASPFKVTVNPLVLHIGTDSFVASPQSLSSSGGTVKLSGKTPNALSCSLSVSPAVAGFGGPIACRGGSFNSIVNLPANVTSNTINYNFTLKIIDRKSDNYLNLKIGVRWKNMLNGIYIVSGLPGPIPMVSDGNHVWVGNYNGNSVTEIDEANGGVVRTLTSPKYGFSQPGELVYDGTNIWVLNINKSSLTEINASTGVLKRVINSASYDFSGSSGLVYDGTNIWVLNSGNDALTELNASTGKLVRVLKYSRAQLGLPIDLTFVHDHTLWIADYGYNKVIELNSNTGSIIRYIDSQQDHIGQPTRIKYISGHIWVTNGTNSLTELNESNGNLIQVINGPKYDFDNPVGITSDGTNLWVVNGGQYNSSTRKFDGGDSLTELNESNGNLIQVINGPGYQFNGSEDLVYDGIHIWVSDYNIGSISEFTP